MAQKRDSSKYIIDSLCTYSSHNNLLYAVQYIDIATVVLKGRKDEYHELLGLLKVIDLSNNKLTGKFPSEILSLLELYTLNVSGNNLIGEIPHLIGQLKKLETLDLSRNQFSGKIPSSMSELSFLNHLNLSYNHLSGKIPSSTQLQSFKAFDFAGNPGLCGLPLSQKCWTSEQTPNQREDGEEYRDEFWKWFYGTAEFGFVVEEREGLPLCNNGCEHDNTVEDVSKARMSTSSMEWLHSCAEGDKLNMHGQELRDSSAAHANYSIGSRV